MRDIRNETLAVLDSVANVTHGRLRPNIVGGEGQLNLPLEPWAGGPAYWAQFAKADAAGWSDPSFFPISVFLVKPENNHPQQLAALGVNVAVALEHNPSALSQACQYLSVIAQPAPTHGGEEWTIAEIGNEPKVVGWFVHDECDQGEGLCWFGGDASQREPQMASWAATLRALDDDRFLFATWGNGITGDILNLDMAGIVQDVDASSVDKYMYTSPDVQDLIEGCTNWPGGNAECSAGYGWMAETLINLYDNPNSRRPFFVVIETKMPYLGETGAQVILYDEMEGAVWSSIIHGAMGIEYFQHNGLYPGGLPVNDPNTGAPHCTGTYSLVDCEQGLKDKVTAVNNKILGLAPVLNTQSYVFNFGATGIKTMLKAKDGYAYIFACVKIGATTGSKTFTLTGSGISGSTAEVVGESRSVNISGDQFTDTFAAEYTHHIYKIWIGGGGGNGGGAANYYTSGSNILDPNGDAIVIRGPEAIYGPSWAWPDGSILDEMSDTGSNGTRVLLQYTANVYIDGLGGLSVAQMETIIERAVSGGMVPDIQIDKATSDNYAIYTNSTILNMLMQYQDRMILHLGESEATSDSAWLTDTNNAVTALRTAGYTCPIFCMSRTAGRNLPCVLDNGAAVVSNDPDHNVILGWQAYWPVPNNYYQNLYGMTLSQGLSYCNDATFPIMVGLTYKTDPWTHQDQMEWETAMTLCQTYGLSWTWWDWVIGGESDVSLTTDGIYGNWSTFGDDVCTVGGHAASIPNTSVRTQYQLDLMP